jgi:hypothetical protein
VKGKTYDLYKQQVTKRKPRHLILTIGRKNKREGEKRRARNLPARHFDITEKQHIHLFARGNIIINDFRLTVVVL